MDVRERRAITANLLGQLQIEMAALIERAPDYWGPEEIGWLIAHRAFTLTDRRNDLGIRLRAFHIWLRDQGLEP
jgi:hypothetical protein